MNAESADARVERERQFHNDRFTDETRAAQGKYYAAIKDGAYRFDLRVRELARNADVLEFGCGNASQACDLARSARSVTGIDISDVAIEVARANADAAGLTNATFKVMNAEAMDFADGSFDLVFGRGIIHHLDLERSFKEISRVLRPGGAALFWEPLGDNVVFNAYRALTPKVRTPDEHPLREGDFAIARKRFGSVSVVCYGLSSLATVPFRDTGFGDALLKTTAALDRALFRLPKVKWQAWYCMMELKEPVRGA
jgi:ubiquinone/menaquinone biosynthesis C-methylase UbiE